MDELAVLQRAYVVDEPDPQVVQRQRTMLNTLIDHAGASSPATRQASGTPLAPAIEAPRLDAPLPRHRWNRSRLVLGPAAALVVGVGAVGIWLSKPGESPTASQPTTTANALAPTTRPAEQVTATSPAFPEPTELAVLDPALQLGAPSRTDPISAWLHPADQPGRWFVRRDADGQPAGAMRFEAWPRTEWIKSFSDGIPVDIGGEIDARVMLDEHSEPSTVVGWLTDDAVEVVWGPGDVSQDEVVAAATSWPGVGLPAVPAPTGFTEISAPIETGAVQYPNGLSVVQYRSASGEPFDVQATAFVHTGLQPEPVGDASLVTRDEEPRFVSAYLELRPGLLVVITDNQGFVDLRTVIDDVITVPAESVATLSHDMAPGDADTVAFGEITAGRWVLRAWTDGAGNSCYSLATSFSGGGGECGPGAAPPVCLLSVGWGIDIGNHYLVVVDHPVSSITVSIDGQEPLEVEPERSGDYTLGYLIVPGENLGVAPVAATVDRRPCTTAS